MSDASLYSIRSAGGSATLHWQHTDQGSLCALRGIMLHPVAELLLNSSVRLVLWIKIMCIRTSTMRLPWGKYGLFPEPDSTLVMAQTRWLSPECWRPSTRVFCDNDWLSFRICRIQGFQTFVSMDLYDQDNLDDYHIILTDYLGNTAWYLGPNGKLTMSTFSDGGLSISTWTGSPGSHFGSKSFILTYIIA